MATADLLLPIAAAVLPDGSTSNAAPAIQRVKSSAAAPAPFFYQLAFDASTDEMCMWSFRMPSNYSSTPVLIVQYKMTSATTGAVRFECYLAAITPNVDTTDADAKAFASSNSTGQTVPATTAGKVNELTITLTNADSLAAGDWVIVYLRRDADGTTGTDDATGDCEVIGVTLQYTTT